MTESVLWSGTLHGLRAVQLLSRRRLSARGFTCRSAFGSGMKVDWEMTKDVRGAGLRRGSARHPTQ